MRRLADEAYVLGTHELGESDLIVTFLAREHGRLRGVAKAARKSRRRYGGALLLLTRVRVVWFERDGRDLHRIESADSLRSYADVQCDPVGQSCCAILAELCRTFAHEGEASLRRFRLLGAVLDALEGGGDPWTLVRYFEYWLMRLEGLLPEFDRCGSCGSAFAHGPQPRVLSTGTLACRSCARGSSERQRTWTRRHREFVDQATVRSPAELAPAGRAVEAGGALELLLRGTLESFAERRFRAYRHLRAHASSRIGPKSI